MEMKAAADHKRLDSSACPGHGLVAQLPAQKGGAGVGYVAYRRIARELERVDSSSHLTNGHTK
jgi:alkylation response protein AidB-like acyl-CoA dehydrogenase